MLDREANETLTRVGPGTIMGRLLRRYWHPLLPASSLSQECPAVAVRILGESLVVFRLADGLFGALDEQCPHRAVSLTYGFVEPSGIRCPYHGWLFDTKGRCLDRPFEPRVQNSIQTSSYPVVEKSGLLFIYMGPPSSISYLPRFDILERTDIGREIHLQADLACNWLQIQENAADTTHTSYLHSKMLERFGVDDDSGFNLQMIRYGFQPFEWGIVKSWAYMKDGEELDGWGNLLVFPTMLRIESELHWRVPIDDRSTRIFILRSIATPTAETVVRHLPDRKRDGRYHLQDFYSQDAMAWETQGVVADRTRERLGASDVGVTMFRKMLHDQLELLDVGKEPTLGRAPHDDSIVDLRQFMGGYLPASAPPDPNSIRRARTEIFDARHKIVTLKE